MSNYDIVYKGLIEDVLKNGVSDEGENVRTVWADGNPANTVSVFGRQYEFDSLPITTTKKLAWKTAIREMLIFWVKQSTKKEDFHSENCHVWDEFFLEDGTIGKSYPYQFESRPKKEIIKVKKRTMQKKTENLNNMIQPLLPLSNRNSKEIGNIYTSKKSGKFIVIDVLEQNSIYKNRCKTALIQFLDTGYTKEVRTDALKNDSNIQDIYYKSVYGVGYQGDLSSIKNMDEKTMKILKQKWYDMIGRCYNEKDSNYSRYGAVGIFVDARWHSLSNFVRDCRYIPQYFIAKNEGFKNWQLDKDYYGSNCYSKDTCVFLHKSENDIYKQWCLPFTLNKDGEKKIFIDKIVAAQYANISTRSISQLLNKKVESIKNITCDVIEEEEYVYRYKISRNQVVDLINNIKKNPSSRRLMTSFWNDADVEEKALQECAYETIWNVKDGTLDTILGQRSLDVGLGCCFNQFQYFVLNQIMAQVCGLKSGKLIHQVGSAHIYTRHIKSLKEQISRSTFEEPTLWVNPEVTDFFDFTIDDFKLINYKHHEKIDMEVAI